VPAISPSQSSTSPVAAAASAASTTSEERMTGELYRDEGVVLRTYKLAESDRIVVLMTAAHGKVRAVAKGVRKTKSKFGARLEPMSHVRLLLYRGRELDIVSQAESIEPLSPMLSSLDRASQGIAAIEAVDQLALEREPNPRLYRMAVGVLRTIAARPSPLNVSAFYWKLLAAEGLEPQLDACVRCGEYGPDVTFVSFDVNEGGVHCRNCRTGTSISAAALAIMRDILGGRLNEALALDESPATHEVSTLATRALEHHIERRLKAVAMFEAH
jgi:DNA repair protein RecO (recombination protein O)